MTCDHPGIVKLIDAYQDTNCTYIVEEYLQLGTLDKYIEKNSLDRGAKL